MLIQPRKALNKAFLKIKPNRSGIELFKQNLMLLLDSIKEKESEEFHKNLISDFLKNTYYSPNHFINTKGRNDLVIHIGKEAKSNVGVIIEAKSPSNKAEMPTQKNINSKALQEMVLYFLRERITHKNLEVKHVVATNVNEWFIFDAQLFDKLFAQNKNLVKQFQDFEEGKLSGKNTDFFYKEIAKPYIETVLDKLEYTYFDLASYDKILRNEDKLDDAKLIVLYKLLSPEHLLKLSFANDSNSLDKNFYNELLHLIGLTETKEGGKKLIERPKAGQRNAGSLLENVINQLDSLDKLSRLPNVKQYGDTHEERLFTVGLELCITWVNRILFLKLLEAQLISYHKGDKSYAFLHKGLLHDYDNLNALFFMVLAKKPEERNERVKTLFAKVPYLNSSLFEPTELEHQTLFISGLEDDIQLPIVSGTVLKDANGKKLTGTHKAIEYFFDFLDAYDFASEGSEEIQEDNKTLINASVLGLIFEKINGYKDGSFYTPSFITMYMCKETIRRAVVQKFNETKGWNCEDFDALYNKIEDTKEANAIINSVKICDPAVGSGHFLVSALNEMIAIKHDLKVLVDREGKRLKEYQVDIVNDELIVTDEDGLPFTYNPKSKESQRVQETLFHEKQTIIENCLFGVDINPNSVKICRLRLWIELLKNAYYRNETELETLPNIDINIKCGNSLIARFGLDADLKEALKKSKLKIEDYKRAVDQYRNAESKEQKRDMELLIEEIKTNFNSELRSNDPKLFKLKRLKEDILFLPTQTSLFEKTAKEKKEFEKNYKKVKDEFTKLETEIEEIKSNKIYENAFEWRFEFPEVLNDEGDFVGFDVVIGNPPYVRVQELGYEQIDYYKKAFKVGIKRVDISILFIELSKNILNDNGLTVYITSNQFLTTEYGESAREFLLNKYQISKIIDFGDAPVFEEALTYVSIFIFKNSKPKNFFYTFIEKDKLRNFTSSINFSEIDISELSSKSWVLKSGIELGIIKKLEKFPKLESIGNCWAGLFTGLDNVLMFDKKELKEISIEPELLLPVLRAQDCDKYLCSEASKYVIYPYKIHNNKTVLLDQNELREKFPYGYDYLLKNKLELSKRKDSRKNISDSNTWFKLTRYGQKNIFDSPKIVSPGEVKNHKFCIDNSKSGFSCARVFAITIDNSKYDLYSILALLNSTLYKYYLQSKSSLKAGGYFSYSSKNINDTPIVDAEKLTNSKVGDIALRIEKLKKDNSAADTTALEREIDFMVYALYGLSEEEIGIVEGN